MSRHEILQYIQSFTEIGLDGQLYGSSGGIRHQPTHSGKLLDLLIGTSGPGVSHHKDVVIFIKSCKKYVRQLFIRFIPGFHHGTVSLFLCNQAATEILGNPVNHCLGLIQHFLLLGGHCHIGDGNRHGRPCGILIARGFDQIQHLCRHGSPMDIDNLFKDLL